MDWLVRSKQGFGVVQAELEGQRIGGWSVCEAEQQNMLDQYCDPESSVSSIKHVLDRVWTGAVVNMYSHSKCDVPSICLTMSYEPSSDFQIHLL